MIRVVKLMLRKINWFAWLVLVVVWNYGFPQATPFQDVIVDKKKFGNEFNLKSRFL